MPQIQLPIFPEGVTYLSTELAFIKKDGLVTYFNGSMPVFSHAENDIGTFRMITSQFVVNGVIKQSEIVKAFGVPLTTVKRYVKLYRDNGPSGFYAERKRRGAAVLTSDVIEKVQDLFDEGLSIPDVSRKLGIKANTLSKAVISGRFHIKKKLFKATKMRR